PLSRRDFWAILRSLPAQGVTVFVSTPYMDEAAQCQRLGFLAQGRLLACDTPARLREQLTGRVLELRCIPLRPARTVLEALPQVHHLEVFGNRLHLLVDDAARDAATVVAALEGEKFTVASCRPIEPSLEDVFIALLGIR
ncbi:MAG TPA: DUF4162 domain-containing protein, partial [Armatimonadetes bacterium]|nr:DUF4162 domain-containing protein [Armatimonadota bacterium]